MLGAEELILQAAVVVKLREFAGWEELEGR